MLLACQIIFILQPTQPLNLLPKIIRRHAQRALTHDRKLFQPVICRNCDAVLVPDLMHGALDKRICGLIGFRVDHIQIVIFAFGTRMLLAIIGFKQLQHRAVLVSLIIA